MFILVKTLVFFITGFLHIWSKQYFRYCWFSLFNAKHFYLYYWFSSCLVKTLLSLLLIFFMSGQNTLFFITGFLHFWSKQYFLFTGLLYFWSKHFFFITSFIYFWSKHFFFFITGFPGFLVKTIFSLLLVFFISGQNIFFITSVEKIGCAYFNEYQVWSKKWFKIFIYQKPILSLCMSLSSVCRLPPG